MLSDDDEIDESWTHDFREVEGPYNRFYKEKSNSIKLFFLYVSSNNEVITIKSERIMLDKENILNKETLYKIIKMKKIYNNLRYNLECILKFNISVEPDDAIECLEGANSEDYIHIESYMKDIYFEDTICTFQDLNSLFFIFQNKNNINCYTRRKLLKTLSRKTRRKRT